MDELLYSSSNEEWKNGLLAEDCDIHNDETFGDTLDDLESFEDGDRFYFDQEGVYSPLHLSSPSDKNFSKQDENEMVEGIRQLVTDDLTSNPLSEPIPIQKLPTNFGDLFGPTSPQAPNNSHLLDVDIKNIWGSPDLSSTNVIKPTHFGENQRRNNVDIISLNPDIKVGKAMTLQELEDQLLQKPSFPPGAISAEELERKLQERYDSPKTLSKPFDVSASLPPLLSNINPPSIDSRSSSESPLEMKMRTDENHQNQVMSGGEMTVRQATPTANLTHRNMQVIVPLQPYDTSALAQHIPMARVASVPAMGAFPRIYSRNLIPAQVVSGTFSPFRTRFVQLMPPVLPPPLTIGTPLPPMRPVRITYSDPAMRSQLINHHHHRLTNTNNNFRWVACQNEIKYPMDNKPIDEYAGLMTRSEKDWISKIQSLQLHTDNPYTDDYYYTMYILNKNKKENRNYRKRKDSSDVTRQPELSGLDMILPFREHTETREYTPIQYAKTLGRLTTSSVHKPRTIIDVSDKGVNPTSESDPVIVSQKLRRFRQLLMDIEKGYNYLLEIDDIGRRIPAVPEESRDALGQERVEVLTKLFNCFHHRKVDNFIGFLAVRKGRNLAAASLPLFTQPQAHEIIDSLLVNIGKIIKKDNRDELYVLIDPLRKVLSAAELSSLERFGSLIHKSTPSLLPDLLRSRFGVGVILSLFCRVELIVVRSSPDEKLNLWPELVTDLYHCLAAVDIVHLARPPDSWIGLSSLFRRFLSEDEVSAISEKLSMFENREDKSDRNVASL